MVKLKADGNTGKIAIYTGADDDPFDDPLANLSRVRFHSDLNFPAVIDIRTGSTSLPSRNRFTESLIDTYTLFSHGQGGFPLVFGRITNLSGNPVLAGSVPVQFNDWGFGRFVTLGANASHVILHEQCATGWAGDDVDDQGFNSANNFSGITLNWEVYVTDTILE